MRHGCTGSQKPLFPHHLLSLATCLEKDGATARVASLHSYFSRLGADPLYYDGSEESLCRFAYLVKDALEQIFKQFYPDVVGLSAFTRDWYTVHVAISVLKALYPDIFVLVGGYDPTFDAEAWLRRDPAPDAVVLGEGEKPMKELVARRFQLEGNIKGVAYLKEGALIYGGLAEPADKEELASCVDFDLLIAPDLDQHLWLNDFVFSRGCPYNCAFCTAPAFSLRKVRFRPLTALEHDLNFFTSKGVQELCLADAIINVSPFHFRRLCDLLSSFQNLKVVVMSRVDLIRPRDVQWMKKGRISVVTLGLESASEGVLAAMKKLSYSCADMRKAAMMLREADIGVGVFVMIGHPGSTREKDLKTYEFLRKLLEEQLVTGFIAHIFKPYPGTFAAKTTHMRTIEPNKANWTHELPVCELLGEDGKIAYSAEEIEEVHSLFLRLGREFGLPWAEDQYLLEELGTT